MSATMQGEASDWRRRDVERGLESPAIYAALRIPELWGFDGETIRIERWTDAGARDCGERAGRLREWGRGRLGALGG